MTRSDRARPFSIITPVRSPAPGGGGEYTRLLASSLVSLPECQSVHVFSERPPGDEDPTRPWRNGVVIRDLWAPRAGLSKRSWQSYLLYLLQQIQAFSLLWRVPRDSVALLHSSFHYNLGCWGIVTRLFRLVRRDLVLISDVRDPLFPTSRVRILRQYDGVIASSESVRSSLLGFDLTVGDIPIPHAVVSSVAVGDPSRPPGWGRYLLFPNGLVKSKGVDRFLSVAHELAHRGEIDHAIIIGRERDEVVIDGDCPVTFHGPVSHECALQLMAGASAVVVLSETEGLSRAALDALGIGAKVVVSESITELATLGPDACVPRSAPVPDIADRVAKVIAAEVDQRRLYDLTRHDPDQVARATVDFALRVAASAQRSGGHGQRGGSTPIAVDEHIERRIG